MRLKHTEPCRECPWRRVAPVGWLGGHPPELYPDAVANNEVPPCHMSDRDTVDPDHVAMCAGALATMSNACILPREPEERTARATVGERDDCFASPAAFYRHHTGGKEYVSFMLRQLAPAK